MICLYFLITPIYFNHSLDEYKMYCVYFILRIYANTLLYVLYSNTYVCFCRMYTCMGMCETRDMQRISVHFYAKNQDKCSWIKIYHIRLFYKVIKLFQTLHFKFYYWKQEAENKYRKEKIRESMLFLNVYF